MLAAAAGLWVGHRRHLAEQAQVKPAGSKPGLLATAAPATADAVSTGLDAVPAGPDSDSGRGSELWVHVAGAVARPGVYRLPPDSRVADAIEAAGGPDDQGVPDAMNLAARLADGDKVYVPSRTELTSPGDTPALASRGSTHAPAGTAGAGDGPVSINRAVAADLERVPGIGPTLAQRIIETRRQRGRFEQLEDLLDVPGIGEKKFEQMKRHLTL